jgi:hypothetical protein
MRVSADRVLLILNIADVARYHTTTRSISAWDQRQLHRAGEWEWQAAEDICLLDVNLTRNELD